MFDLIVSPRTPASNTNTLEDVDTKLTDVHKEENKKSERAVAPAGRTKKEKMSETEETLPVLFVFSSRSVYLNAP